MPRRLSVVALVALLAFASLRALPFAHASSGSSSTATVALHAKDRASAAAKAYALLSAQLAAGTAQPDAVYTWSRRWAEAEADSGGKSAWTDHLARMTKLEATVTSRVAAGLGAAAEVPAAAFYVAEAKGMAGAP